MGPLTFRLLVKFKCSSYYSIGLGVIRLSISTPSVRISVSIQRVNPSERLPIFGHQVVVRCVGGVTVMICNV